MQQTHHTAVLEVFGKKQKDWCTGESQDVWQLAAESAQQTLIPG